MKPIKNHQSRRAFFMTSAAAAGGLMLSYSWISTQGESWSTQESLVPLETELNGFIIIKEDNTVIIFSQNPEIGQNIKTSMPMIVAEELDVDWKNVVVKQADLNNGKYKRQVAGGSQSIHKSWSVLREAGATARQILVASAADKWGTTVNDLYTEKGFVIHKSGEKLSYGELAATAATMEIPKQVKLKNPKDFKIIGKPILNVDATDIVTGTPLFGFDTQRKGMVYARVLRPPGFGMVLNSIDDTETRSIKGVIDVLELDNKVAVIANSTWTAINGVKVLKANWSKALSSEDSTMHQKKLLELINNKSKKPKVNQGNVEEAFTQADAILERTYEAPFLPHNCLEPMNFFADVSDKKVELYGPIQTPANSRKAVAQLLKRNESEISVGISRIGGGFGRRLRGDFVLEAAQISDKIRKPVQLIYTREDDMTAGVYRPASAYRIKAGIKDGKILAYHLTGAGVRMRNTVRPGTWPQAAVPNFKLETHTLKSEITTGAWRAPTSNFLAFAEQVFIDELAELAKIDPIDFRLESLKQAEKSPIGKAKYKPSRLAGVIKLAAEKSDWHTKKKGVFKGISAYYSHDSYVAEVAEITIENGQPKITRIVVATDCGIIINKSGAANQAMGGVVDGIGHAMYGELTFNNGVPVQNNFDSYRHMRNPECPKVETHFVESNEDPTGLGEPTLPPAAAALANAIYAGIGKRIYSQPFSKHGISLV